MAKKKTYRRKRKVGAMSLSPQSPVVKGVSVLAGYLLAGNINPLIDKVIPASISSSTGVTKYIPAAAQIGVGGYFLMRKKEQSIVVTAAAGVLAGAGISRAMKNAGIISGFNAIPTMGGFNRIPTMGRVVPSQLGTVPGQLEGFRTRNMGGFRTSRVMGGMTEGGSGVNSTDR